MAITREQIEQEALRRQLQNLDERDDQVRIQEQSKARLLQAIEAEAARREKAKEPAPERWEISPSVGLAADLAGGVNEAALDMADFITAGPRLFGEFVSRKDVRSPSEVLNDYGVGGDQRYLSDPLVSNVANALGYTLGAAAGFKGVPRDPSDLRNVAADIFGIGASELTATQLTARKTLEALSRTDDRLLGKNPSEWSDGEILEAAQSHIDRGNIIANRRLMDDYDTAMAEIAKFESKENPTPQDLKKFEEIEVPDGIQVGDLDEALKFLEARGVPLDKAAKAIQKGGGIQFRTLEELIQLDKKFTTASGRGTDVNWYDRNFLPVADLIRNKVDRVVGSVWERAVESNMRYTATLADRHRGILPIARLANEDRGFKRLLLDLPTGRAEVGEVRDAIRNKLGSEGVRNFDKFMAETQTMSARARERLYANPEDFADEFYLHTERRGNKDSLLASIGPRGDAGTERPSSLQARERKPAFKMTDEEVDQYMNPIMTNLRHLGQQDQQIRIATALELRPSLRKGGTSEELWEEVKNKLMRDGMDERRAAAASKLMASAYIGSKRTPPPVVRAFMSLGYAGTLAQLKSAVLNLHDVFVTMFTQGVRPTLSGMRQTLKSEFGKTFDELGLEGQSVGEFVKGGESALEDPTVMNKIADSTRKLAEGAMFVSGFKALDSYGKSTVLKSAVQRLRRAAQNNSLAEQFSDIASREQLQRIRPYLQAGMPAKDMPQDVAAIIEELAFVQLGRQQLISYAGRPLGYLRNPAFRPAWAMTGFAVKQQALLRDLVMNNIRQGNYRLAGQNAMAYILYAGVGYAGLDTARESVFKREPQDEADFMMSVIDQMMGAMFLNKFDTGSFDRLGTNPVDYIMTAFLPPGGITEAVLQDVSQFIQSLADGDVEPPENLMKRAPLLGDFYRYWWNE